MDVVYALEEPPIEYRSAVFLAGPTPRDTDSASWRPDALAAFERVGYGGVVFVPEDRSGVFHGDYDGQVGWEDRCLHLSDAVLFWVPRRMRGMPALTTNVEFGRWERSGRMTFGAPPEAERVAYLRRYASEVGAPSVEALDELVERTVELVGDGARRCGVEREIPLHVWRSDAFQEWYRGLDGTLESARVEWTDLEEPGRALVRVVVDGRRSLLLVSEDGSRAV